MDWMEEARRNNRMEEWRRKKKEGWKRKKKEERRNDEEERRKKKQKQKQKRRRKYRKEHQGSQNPWFNSPNAAGENASTTADPGSWFCEKSEKVDILTPSRNFPDRKCKKLGTHWKKRNWFGVAKSDLKTARFYPRRRRPHQTAENIPFQAAAGENFRRRTVHSVDILAILSPDSDSQEQRKNRSAAFRDTPKIQILPLRGAI